MKEIETVLASNIIQLRRQAGMTQIDLAAKLNYSDKSVSKWERAESLPDIAVLKNMADIFGVTVDYLITAHDPNEKKSLITHMGLLPHAIITWISIIGIWILALLIFVICWICGSIRWMIFIPPSILTRGYTPRISPAASPMRRCWAIRASSPSRRRKPSSMVCALC